MYSEALAFQKRHQNYFDFSEFYPNDNKVQPIYFSFVRHPVERIISWYYYVRESSYQFDDIIIAVLVLIECVPILFRS